MGKGSSSTIQTSLKTALSYVEEVEKSLEGFNETVSSEAQKVMANDSWRGIGTALKGRWVVGKEKGKLMNDLNLAEDELKTAEQNAPDARLEIGEETFTIPLIMAMVYELRGRISCLAGEFKRGEEYFKTSLNHFEVPNTYYGLALVLEELKRPREACEMHQKCIDLAADIQHDFKGTSLEADMEKTAIQARKDLQRLKSKKIGEGWFVGSWKIFLILAGCAVLGFLIAILANQPANIPMSIASGIFAAGYWFWKWRADGLSTKNDIGSLTQVERAEPLANEEINIPKIVSAPSLKEPVFKYRWTMHAQEYIGQKQCKDEDALSKHVGSAGGKLLEILEKDGTVIKNPKA